MYFFFFSSRRRHTRCSRDWSSDVCSSDLVVQRPGVFVAQAHFDGRRAGKLEAVLEEAIGRPRAKLHLRNAGLALLHGGQTEQETGEGGSAAVVCAGSRRVAARTGRNRDSGRNPT